MRGIVITRQAFRENDLLVLILCENTGIIEVVARGAQKFESKMASHLEPLNLVSIDIAPGKKLSYIINIYSISCFCDLKENFKRLSIALEAVFFINKVMKRNIWNYEVFILLLELLMLLNNVKNKIIISSELLLNIFVFRLHALESLLLERKEYYSFCANFKLNAFDKEYEVIKKIIIKHRLIELLSFRFNERQLQILNNNYKYFKKFA